MAYDEGLATRIEELLDEQAGITQRKMFGGLAFMYQGHMFCGINGDELMLRVGAEHYEQILDEPHIRPMDFTGKPLRGYVYVAADGITEDTDLAHRVQQGLDVAAALPPKIKRPAPKKKKKTF